MYHSESSKHGVWDLEGMGNLLSQGMGKVFVEEPKRPQSGALTLPLIKAQDYYII